METAHAARGETGVDRRGSGLALFKLERLAPGAQAPRIVFSRQRPATTELHQQDLRSALVAKAQAAGSELCLDAFELMSIEELICQTIQS